MTNREHILSEIRRTATENHGKPLGKVRFLAETGIREADWLGRFWTKWSDAVRDAGFEPNQLQGPLDEHEVLNHLALETRRLGHFPTYAELRLRRHQMHDFPSRGVFDRFGPKRELTARVADFCRQRPDFADVLQILLTQVAPTDSESMNDERATPEYGFVYLLKSGRHYKLGRTSSLGRREYELAIQLPERATRVHTIQTDDPPGIEAYWHERFADRRANGEWFKLTADDVRAFKRRRLFM